MEKQVNEIKSLIISLMNQVPNSIDNSEIEEVMIEKIKSLNLKDIERVACVGNLMARKYQNGDNFPPTDKAVLLEYEFGIHPRYWVINKQIRHMEK